MGDLALAVGAITWKTAQAIYILLALPAALLSHPYSMRMLVYFRSPQLLPAFPYSKWLWRQQKRDANRVRGIPQACDTRRDAARGAVGAGCCSDAIPFSRVRAFMPLRVHSACIRTATPYSDGWMQSY
jgi:hypothetical protein